MAGVGRPPRARDLVRLKLRLLGNSLRGQTWRVVAFVLGSLFGLLFAALAALALSATAELAGETAFVITVFAGAAAVLGWALLPLLFFGVDETLDPARFALLPLRPGMLARGMLAAAFVGTPVVVTLVVSAGLVHAAWRRSGSPAAVAAAVGVVAGLTVGVVASRAITSAFATMLRSRRVRDLAIVVIAVLASSIAPLQLVIASAVERGNVEGLGRVANVLAWTPLGAPYALSFDVAAQRWTQAGARLAITLVAIGLLLWWWSRTIESAMLGAAGGSGSGKVKLARGGAVAALVPRLLRTASRPSAFAAIAAREVRFWWRDPRRRASLVSLLLATAVLPFVIVLGQGNRASTLSGFTFAFVISMVGTLGGMTLANQFAFDGNAFALHMLSQVPGRVEIRARAAAVGLVTLPVQLLVVVGVGIAADEMRQLPTGLGLLATAFGVSIAVAGLLSVLAAYPMPDNGNPFATNTGSGSAKSLLALLAIVATLVLCAPVVAASLLLTGLALGPWLVLVLGLGYGGLALWLGTVIVGDLIERRGPELLVAITPRR